jgi:hypothetical protein
MRMTLTSWVTSQSFETYDYARVSGSASQKSPNGACATVACSVNFLGLETLKKSPSRNWSESLRRSMSVMAIFQQRPGTCIDHGASGDAVFGRTAKRIESNA